MKISQKQSDIKDPEQKIQDTERRTFKRSFFQNDLKEIDIIVLPALHAALWCRLIIK